MMYLQKQESKSEGHGHWHCTPRLKLVYMQKYPTNLHFNTVALETLSEKNSFYIYT